MEKIAWKSIKNVTTNFLGNHKADNYGDMVDDIKQSHEGVGV